MDQKPNPNSIQGAAHAALNRLAKWRTILAGWQLGTRAKGDPVCDAVRDHREATLMLRADVDALTDLLIAKGIFTTEEYLRAVADAAEMCNHQLEQRFPGVRATEQGIELDRDKARPWMSKFPK